ncbi:MAG TPA: Hpt domain-containing protein, partial [Kofleriaceae bacterium]|nr:Hpt domain-containing protein [Kofleriaceae bacterium]
MTADFDTAQFVPVFLEECGEHLLTLEGSLLELERRPDDADLLGRLFRAAHSIKGGAGMFGFGSVARLTHGLESMLDAMRARTLVPAAAHIELLLRGTDTVRALLAAARDGVAEPPIDELLDGCRRVLGEPGTVPAVAFAAAARPCRRFRLELVPGRDVFRHGLDPMRALRELLAAGELVDARCDASRLPRLADLDPDSCYLGWQLELRTTRDAADLEALLATVVDGGTATVTAIDEPPAAAVTVPAPPPPPIASPAPPIASPQPPPIASPAPP